VFLAFGWVEHDYCQFLPHCESVNFQADLASDIGQTANKERIAYNSSSLAWRRSSFCKQAVEKDRDTRSACSRCM